MKLETKGLCAFFRRNFSFQCPATLPLMALTLWMCGCSADVTHQLDNGSASNSGIRYYDSSPYLIIYSNGAGGLNWQINYLPDQSKLMTVKPSIVGGHAAVTLAFQNGVLTTEAASGDTTDIPKAILAAVQSAIPLLTSAILEAPKHNGFPSPYIYKLEVTNNILTFIGGQGDASIQVPLNLGPTQ